MTSDFKPPYGFEEARSPILPHRRAPVVTPWSPHLGGGGDTKARLARLASGAPEVLVRSTGSSSDHRALRIHLDYISRKGELDLKAGDGGVISGQDAVRDLARDWAAMERLDSRRVANSPLSHSLVLAASPGADEEALQRAAGEFAQAHFSQKFAFVSVLHTDTGHPHVHLAIRHLGDDGERFYPSQLGWKTWRETFAEALRGQGVEVQATRRWARGVSRKSERFLVRKMRERYEVGQGPLPKVLHEAYQGAARAVFLGETGPTPWEEEIVARQTKVRSLYLTQAKALARSQDLADQHLAAKLEAFVEAMPAPDSQRLAIARALRASMDLKTPKLGPGRAIDAPERGRTLGPKL